MQRYDQEGLRCKKSRCCEGALDPAALGFPIPGLPGAPQAPGVVPPKMPGAVPGIPGAPGMPPGPPGLTMPGLGCGSCGGIGGLQMPPGKSLEAKTKPPSHPPFRVFAGQQPHHLCKNDATHTTIKMSRCLQLSGTEIENEGTPSPEHSYPRKDRLDFKNLRWTRSFKASEDGLVRRPTATSRPRRAWSAASARPTHIP